MDRKSRLSIFDNIHLLKDIELKRKNYFFYTLNNQVF